MNKNRVIIIFGPMGSGKTYRAAKIISRRLRLIGNIAKYTVHSPTYSIYFTYGLNDEILHLDAYRVKIDSLESLIREVKSIHNPQLIVIETDCIHKLNLLVCLMSKCKVIKI